MDKKWWCEKPHNPSDLLFDIVPITNMDNPTANTTLINNTTKKQVCLECFFIVKRYSDDASLSKTQFTKLKWGKRLRFVYLKKPSETRVESKCSCSHQACWLWHEIVPKALLQPTPTWRLGDLALYTQISTLSSASPVCSKQQWEFNIAFTSYKLSQQKIELPSNIPCSVLLLPQSQESQLQHPSLKSGGTEKCLLLYPFSVKFDEDQKQWGNMLV